MAHIREVIRSNLHERELSLENMGIDRLDDILPDLAKMPNLRELSLRNNRIGQLPADLSSLKTLEVLFLDGNGEFEVEAVIESVNSMPSLKHLYVTLPSEDAEDELIVACTNILSLNGLEIPQADEIDDAVLETSVGAEQEEEGAEDVETRREEGEEEKEDGGKEGGEEREEREEQEEKNIESEEKEEDADVDAVGGEEEVEGEEEDAFEDEVQHMDDEESWRLVRDVEKEIDPEDPSSWFTDAFRSELEVAFEKGHENLGIPPRVELTEILPEMVYKLSEERRKWLRSRARHKVRTKLPSVLRDMDEMEFWENVQLQGAARAEVLWMCLDDVMSYVTTVTPNVAAPMKVVEQGLQEVLHMLSGTFSKMRQRHVERMTKMHEDIRKAEKETAELLEAARVLEAETKAFSEEKTRLTTLFERERSQLIEELGWLRSENEKILNRLRQYELQRSSSATPSSASKRILGTSSSSASASGSAPLSLTAGAFSTSSGGPPSAAVAAARQVASEGPQPSKQLTLRQLKEVMEEIYASKLRFDSKCQDMHTPRETMEQHVYTFLNQKYGLKSLIVEWASAIINGVREFSEKDNDVRVFGMILRNEIDEEFRFVQAQLKETVMELLRVYLKGKYRMRRDDEIQTALERKMKQYLVEDEWVDVIKYMYNQEDSVNIIVRVKDAIRKIEAEDAAASSSSPRFRAGEERQRAVGMSRFEESRALRRRQPGGAGKKSQNRIRYEAFLQVLLDFQLSGHERFLRKFTKLFRQFDADRDGVVNEDQFRKLMLAVDSERNSDDALLLVDPYQNEHITYSECVTFLSAELVKMMTGRP
eukprot:TRINITY_DN640_c0_g1_i1.p1 TRINITY_DN640_c0_g1~~TRINITY_DN640_c0_g1_i1.p1  ORF type:complete len:822 (-),score=313.57 TRINITY_DN640_c0_g1_i1:462-2927(-)